MSSGLARRRARHFGEPPAHRRRAHNRRDVKKALASLTRKHFVPPLVNALFSWDKFSLTARLMEYGRGRA